MISGTIEFNQFASIRLILPAKFGDHTYGNKDSQLNKTKSLAADYISQPYKLNLFKVITKHVRKNNSFRSK